MQNTKLNLDFRQILSIFSHEYVPIITHNYTFKSLLAYVKFKFSCSLPGSQLHPGLKGKVGFLEFWAHWRQGLGAVVGWGKLCRSLVPKTHWSEMEPQATMSKKGKALPPLALQSAAVRKQPESLVSAILLSWSPRAKRWAESHLSTSLLETLGDSSSFCLIPPVKTDS